MTDQKHTKEPWKISDDSDYPEAVILTDETMIADANIFGAGSSKKKNMANAKRIVDCVNACAGIETPQDLRTQLDAVTKQRDELREACSVLHDIKWQLENSEMDMSDIAQFTNEIYHACDVLTKTKRKS